MLATLLLLVLAINGGLFTGTILYTAHKAARMDQVIGLAQKLWDLPASLY